MKVATPAAEKNPDRRPEARPARRDSRSRSLDEFVRNAQEELDRQALAHYGAQGFSRWRDGAGRGRMDAPSAQARVTGGCGDSIEVFLRVENGVIACASFDTDGCAGSHICASATVELACGLDLDQAAAIDAAAILARLENFPPEDVHCATLAAAALHEAIHRCFVPGEPPAAPLHPGPEPER